MTAAVQLDEVQAVGDAARAAVLLQHPVRSRIVALAREPISATEIAARLGQPRQRVNYHVRKLARARFLRRAGKRRRRNMVEQRYLATARAYVIDPAVLGPLAARPSSAADALSAAALYAVTSRAQAEVAQAAAEAAAQGRRLATLSMAADLRFTSAEQRAAFTAALQTAVAGVLAKFTAPFARADGSAAPGRPYRLFLGCHPIPIGKEDQR